MNQRRLSSRTSSHNFAPIHPSKLGEALAKYLSQDFKFSLGPNLWFTFDEGPLRGMGDSTYLTAIFAGYFSPVFSELGGPNYGKFGDAAEIYFRLPTCC